MDTNQIVRVKHVNKSIDKTKSISQSAQQALVEQLEIGQPERIEPVVPLEFLAEPPKDESVYGSGWSLAELMDEFGGRES